MKFDAFIIGGGSGGVRCARILAQAGKKVGIAEATHWGGVCVNLGCVPKKLFVYAAGYSQHLEDAEGYGWQIPKGVEFCWQQLVANKNREIARLNQIYQNILATNGVRMFKAKASFIGENRLKVGNEEVTARHIIIASGSHPRLPQVNAKGELIGDGASPEESPEKHKAKSAVSNLKAFGNVLVSDEMFHLKRLPKSLVVVGGGYIALEFASIMSGLGVKVTLVHRGQMPLRGFDEELRRFATKALGQRLKLAMDTTLVSLKKSGSQTVATTQRGEVIKAEAFLFAIGRVPNTQGLGLRQGGIKTRNANGAVKINGSFKTSNPNVFAIGDVKGEPQLTPVAIAEGHYLALKLLGEKPKPLDYSLIPTAVFMAPTLATVGAGEDPSKHLSYKTEFTPMEQILPQQARKPLRRKAREQKAFIKIVVQKSTKRVVGVHLLADGAAEIIQSLAPALGAGITASQLRHTMPLHPTLAEEVITLLPK